jgi:cation:H+ antiporter
MVFYFSGKTIVKSLIKIAKYLGWKEFALSFIVMAFVASFPNLFVGISSALHDIPELAFGDIIGGNLIDLTLSIGLAAMFAKKGIPAKSRTIQTTLFFTIIAAILPLMLACDHTVSRGDGIILILFFLIYVGWLFSKKERFTKTCEEEKPIIKSFHASFQSIFKIIFSVIMFIIASEGIVRSARYFADMFDWPILLIGLFIVGLGNCLPEIFFAVSSAKHNYGWMVLGDLMGAVVAPATLVLGIVALINPIHINGFAHLALARIFMFISIIFFFIFIKNDQKITKKEATFLILVYIVFIISEIFIGI